MTRLTGDRVLPLLRGRFGGPYHWAAECPSTQYAMRDPSLPEGAVMVAEHQTAGRGREARVWEDVPGRSLLFSLRLLPPAGSPTHQLSLVAGLAVAEAIETVTGLGAQVKWPNDVLLQRRKVAGILLESAEGAVICGIGLNVSQTSAELPVGARVPAGSLLTATGLEHDRATLLAEILVGLERRYDGWRELGLGPLVPELDRRDALRTKRVGAGGLTGEAVGIAADGRLRVVVDGKETLVASGEVALLDG